MQRTTMPLLATVLTLALPPFAAAGEAPTTLIVPGAYHGDELRVESQAGWLALHPGGDHGRAHLDMVTLAVETVFDAVVDGTGEASGRQVTVAGTGGAPTAEPLLLLAADLGLHPGRVTEATPAAAELRVDEPLRLTLWSTPYDLVLLRVDPPPSAARWRGEGKGLLFLRYGGTVQQLAEFPLYLDGPDSDVTIGSEAQPALLWAGDLDGDDRLDLVLELSQHYNVSQKVLLLSTAAARGELVGKVAEHVSSGC